MSQEKQWELLYLLLNTKHELIAKVEKVIGVGPPWWDSWLVKVLTIHYELAGKLPNPSHSRIQIIQNFTEHIFLQLLCCFPSAPALWTSKVVADDLLARIALGLSSGRKKKKKNHRQPRLCQSALQVLKENCRSVSVSSLREIVSFSLVDAYRWFLEQEIMVFPGILIKLAHVHYSAGKVWDILSLLWEHTFVLISSSPSMAIFSCWLTLWHSISINLVDKSSVRRLLRLILSFPDFFPFQRKVSVVIWMSVWLSCFDQLKQMLLGSRNIKGFNETSKGHKPYCLCAIVWFRAIVGVHTSSVFSALKPHC